MKTGSLIVSIDRIQPNPWNPNKMEKALYDKLKRGLKKTLADSGKMPPIVVRPNKKRNCYEIIDGEHRWKALKELKEKKVNVYSLEVDDKFARILTVNLNYLRGRPEYDKLNQNLVEMYELGATTEELKDLLPYSEDELYTMMEESKISLKAYQNMLKDDEEKERAEGGKDEVEKLKGLDSDDDSLWLDVKFKLSLAQSKIIEKELSRISATLKGKNARGRALEYMAVLSSQNDLPTT